MSKATLRLVNREWQGGQIDDYYLGSRLTEFLCPPSTTETATVPVRAPEDAVAEDREQLHGIDGYNVVLEHLRQAQQIVEKCQPDRIVVIAGDCSAEVAPFSYLAGKYGAGFGVIWIDAHPDLWDATNNSHFNAMAMSALLGECEPGIDDQIRHQVNIDNVRWVGLRSELDPSMPHLQQALAQRTTAEQFNGSPDSVIHWARSRGISHVAVHVDLDSMDPTEFNLTAVPEVDGVRFEAVLKLFTALSGEVEVVGVGIAEHAPRVLTRLRGFLAQVPLLND